MARWPDGQMARLPGGKKISQIQYRALLRRTDGSLAEFRPQRVDHMTSDATSLDLSRILRLFLKCQSSCKCPQGPIDILIGMDHMCEAPRKHELKGRLVLYK
jgi:hypothetical protein